VAGAQWKACEYYEVEEARNDGITSMHIAPKPDAPGKFEVLVTTSNDPKQQNIFADLWVMAGGRVSQFSGVIDCSVQMRRELAKLLGPGSPLEAELVLFVQDMALMISGVLPKLRQPALPKGVTIVSEECQMVDGEFHSTLVLSVKPGEQPARNVEFAMHGEEFTCKLLGSDK